MNTGFIENLIRKMVQPLMRGSIAKNDGLKAALDDLVPFGTGDHFQASFPFGFVSRPAPGVLAYFLNLFGRTQNPIILSHLHKNRPTPDADGSSIVYCTDAGGNTFPVKLTLKASGTLLVDANTAVVVTAPSIKIGSNGSAEPLVLGNVYKTLYNAHQHIGNLGIPTGPPIIPMGSSHISAKAFTEI